MVLKHFVLQLIALETILLEICIAASIQLIPIDTLNNAEKITKTDGFVIATTIYPLLLFTEDVTGLNKIEDNKWQIKVTQNIRPIRQADFGQTENDFQFPTNPNDVSTSAPSSASAGSPGAPTGTGIGSGCFEAACQFG